MFYCDPCAKENDYPQTLMRSKGPCEVCGKKALCNDKPSSQLISAEDRERIDKMMEGRCNTCGQLEADGHECIK